MNTTGWHRGGQANPVTWPTLAFQLTAAPAGVTSPILARFLPASVAKVPPAKMSPLGAARTTYTVSFAPGLKLVAAPAVVTAPMLWRGLPASVVKLPPT